MENTEVEEKTEEKVRLYYFAIDLELMGGPSGSIYGEAVPTPELDLRNAIAQAFGVAERSIVVENVILTPGSYYENRSGVVLFHIFGSKIQLQVKFSSRFHEKYD